MHIDELTAVFVLELKKTIAYFRNHETVTYNYGYNLFEKSSRLRS